MNKNLEELLNQSSRLWRGRDFQASVSGISTGYAALDAVLPERGWPTQGLIEVVSDQQGIGELQLFQPLLRLLSRQKRRVVWVSPPYIPYAPALQSAGIDPAYHVLIKSSCSRQQVLWSIEKLLKTPQCGLLFFWFDSLPEKALRRLQLAAEQGQGYGVLFCSKPIAYSGSALRLGLTPAGLLTTVSGQRPAQQLQIEILKAKGTFLRHKIKLVLADGFSDGGNS